MADCCIFVVSITIYTSVHSNKLEVCVTMDFAFNLSLSAINAAKAFGKRPLSDIYNVQFLTNYCNELLIFKLYQLSYPFSQSGVSFYPIYHYQPRLLCPFRKRYDWCFDAIYIHISFCIPCNDTHILAFQFLASLL